MNEYQNVDVGPRSFFKTVSCSSVSSMNSASSNTEERASKVG